MSLLGLAAEARGDVAHTHPMSRMPFTASTKRGIARRSSLLCHVHGSEAALNSPPLRLRGGVITEESFGPYMHTEIPDMNNQEVDEEMQAWMRTSDAAQVHPRLMQVSVWTRLSHDYE